LDGYLRDGWSKNFKIDITDSAKQKMGEATKGKKFMIHQLTKQIIRVSSDKIAEYQNKNWKLGLKL
jgi:hypothetical protein